MKKINFQNMTFEEVLSRDELKKIQGGGLEPKCDCTFTTSEGLEIPSLDVYMANPSETSCETACETVCTSARDNGGDCVSSAYVYTPAT